MAKKFFVDSENVGDAWIDMYLEDTADSDFLIFYTDRTPYMDYEHLAALLNSSKKKPEFIKCYVGNNALDFQLVSYLGNQLRDKDTDEVIVVSNDTGFDSIVHFWSDREVNIHRIPTKDVQKTVAKEEKAPVSEEKTAESSSVELSDIPSGANIDDLYAVVNCIGGGKKNSAMINSAFVKLYGQKKGNEHYKFMRKNSFAVPEVQWTPNTRVKKFCELICKYCNAGNIAVPDDFFAFLYDNLTTKGKKTIANKTIEKYGKKLGPQLNKMFKPFYSIIVEIRK